MVELLLLLTNIFRKSDTLFQKTLKALALQYIFVLNLI